MKRIITLTLVLCVLAGCSELSQKKVLKTEIDEKELTTKIEISKPTLNELSVATESIYDYSEDEILDLKQRFLTLDIFVNFDSEVSDEFLDEIEKIKEEYNDTSERGFWQTKTYYSFIYDTDGNFADTSLDYLMVVNKKMSLPYNFEPEGLRVPDVELAYEISLEDECATATEAMFEAALEDGVNLVLTSGYRDFYWQKRLFENQYNKTGSFEAANQFVALEGESEHQTGLAIDITSASVGYGLSQTFENTIEFVWLEKNAADFGFILRYHKDRTEDTGYAYEPWHFRYVGSSEIANEIVDKGLILEEYVY